MWERPSPLAGYFTTCGNLNGDGTFAYRLAGFPLTVQRLVMLGSDKLRKPENRLYAEGTLHGSTWEARHELFSVKYLLHLPFIFFAIWLGGGLWWVARRLFGNEGGFFALGLYCFCPAIVRYAVTPNNEVLAMWGLYGVSTRPWESPTPCSPRAANGGHASRSLPSPLASPPQPTSSPQSSASSSAPSGCSTLQSVAAATSCRS